MEINCPDSTWNDVRGASDVSQCRPCPQPGTICRSGEPLRVSAGYYMDGVAANHSYRCATRAACLGGELSFGDASCEAGYTGLICGACKAGYYRGRRTCLSCESLDVEGRLGARMSTILFLPILSVGVVLLIALYLRPPRACARLSALGCTCATMQAADEAAGGDDRRARSISYAKSPGASFLSCAGRASLTLSWRRSTSSTSRSSRRCRPSAVGGALASSPSRIPDVRAPLSLACAAHRRRHGRRASAREPADASSDGRRGLLTALNHPRVYKVLTWTMLLIYPSLARKSLATFDCLAAGLDASGAPVVLLRDDPVEPCYVGAWIGWAVVAGVGVAVYCLGLPLIALLLARGEHLRTAEDAAASERAALLVNNYEPDFWYCEAVLLLHKLAFTGVIHLIAPETRLQLWCGMLGSLLTFILYLQARPFKHAIVDNVQAAALLQILFTYISAFLFFSDGGEEFHDEVWLGAVLTAVNSVCFVVLLVTVVASAYRARRRAMRTRLHFLDTGEPVTARKLPPQLEYHLFLSHQWGTGQDQMRVTKSRLLEMMPDVQIFLDVDVKGLRLGDLESYVRASEVVLCFCSQGYFSSRNCLRELRAAVRLDKPLLALLEPDESKGSMSVEQIRAAHGGRLMLKCLAALTRSAQRGAAGGRAVAREPIEFNRLGPFKT